uniref:TIL domain-containing protein n=1 Tax=Anopheles maculatus TaxID=74869 RepID=A0A182SRE7_9DIPT
MLVYEPTCVCLEGYVRHNGQCIPKSHCPALPTVKPSPCETTTVPSCESTTPPPPPCTTTTPAPSTVQLPPCTKTKPPCPSTPAPTTTPCPPPTTTPPPTTAPCSKPPEPCAACEELVFVQPCCEPTCDFDCSNTAAACPLVLVQQPTCACRPGLVRYQGHCIEPSACPKSASRYRLYVPVAAQCLKCGK